MDRPNNPHPTIRGAERAAADAPANEPKKPWHRPAIRASAHFDKQALACTMADQGPPFCTGGSSSG